MKKRFSSSRAFVLLEALFCLVLVVSAFKMFGTYISLPKPSFSDKSLKIPTQIESQSLRKLQSHSLVFDVKYKRLRDSDRVYFSFEVLP